MCTRVKRCVQHASVTSHDLYSCIWMNQLCFPYYKFAQANGSYHYSMIFSNYKMSLSFNKIAIFDYIISLKIAFSCQSTDFTAPEVHFVQLVFSCQKWNICNSCSAFMQILSHVHAWNKTSQVHQQQLLLPQVLMSSRLSLSVHHLFWSQECQFLQRQMQVSVWEGEVVHGSMEGIQWVHIYYYSWSCMYTIAVEHGVSTTSAYFLAFQFHSN